MPSALTGLKVVDLTQHLSGPYCAMILADQGADVIKIEPPGSGDASRDMPPFLGPKGGKREGAPFMLWNRNKRSVVLDLKTPQGLADAQALARRADVLIENYRPGVAARLGLGYVALARKNKGLVYCSISGFGQTGPYRDRGGFDLMSQAMSGLMATCGAVDGPPLRLPIAISDVAAGMFGAIGVLSALQARQRTGRGQQIDVSLFESAIALQVYEAAYYFATDERPPRLGQAHRGSSPYQVFQTGDGWMTVGGSPQAMYERLCKLLGAERLIADPRFRTNTDRVRNNDALVALLSAKLRRETTDHWMTAMGAAGIPAGPVMTHDQVFHDPQVLSRQMVVPIDHPVAGRTRTLGIPVKLSATPGSVRRPAPTLGQHTDQVLRALRRAGGKKVRAAAEPGGATALRRAPPRARSPRRDRRAGRHTNRAD
jgi:crotonobetainyl-CoA:carnitine CoA-transferase CaiB-like acyl-CoA transferase